MIVCEDKVFDGVCGEDISYGFFGREGGVSKGIYASLNCGTGSNDDQKDVEHNRSIVAQKIGAEDGRISTLWQCHSSDCLIVNWHVPKGDLRPKADAMVTDVAGLAIGVLTADCGPVLFAAKKADGAPIIGAAHAGWGGALGGVLENTVQRMIDLGAQLPTVTACVGPCIAQSSYEVGPEFSKPFLLKHEEAERFFKSGQKAGHMMFDLAGYIAYRLSLCGVGQVRLTGVDTYANDQKCFSYRRATHRAEPDYGREMSAIVIKA